MPAAIQIDYPQGLEVSIDGPDLGWSVDWTVATDLRSPLSGWSDSNDRYVEAVREGLKAAGIIADVDAESSCTFIHAGTEDDARKVAAVLAEVIPPMWAEKRPYTGWQKAF